MPRTLLLADDSVTIQKVVGISFANEDVRLVTVDNGDDALARAREERPDLVERYTRFLEQQFRAHQDLAQLFSRPEESPLTSEQLETLRSLGYIQ